MTEILSLPDLLARCRDGDPSALEAFARRYGPEIERLARAILGEEEDSADAAQEALLAVLGGLERFRGESGLRTWIFAVAINTCRQKLRRRRASERLAVLLGGVLRVQRPESVEQSAERRLDLRSALRCLDENHRIPVVLHYGHGLSVAEIAAVLRLPQNTVLSRLYHARLKLRRMLEGEV